MPPVEERSFIETAVNLETWSGPIGWCRRDRSEFLTPESRLPVRRTRVVKRPLSLLTERALLYHFDGSGDDALGFYRLNVPENLFVDGGFDGKGGALKFSGKETFPMRFRVWPGSTATIRFCVRKSASAATFASRLPGSVTSRRLPPFFGAFRCGI